ncbi:MAG: monovalent cation/H(+) antiporter subunit G [Candidatus Diapherotrites archaeon]|nr:monovalent cation/H(+) antiporter subunit G [Candidatus Diapherotrites archaeon]
MIELLIYVFISMGLLFHVIGALALHRFFDPYTRLHGSTLCTTFGSIFLALAAIIYALQTGLFPIALHVFLAIVFLMVTNATGAHAIARGAYLHGIKPKRLAVDELAKVRK